MSYAKTRTLNVDTSGYIPKKNCQKKLTLHSPFCPFSLKKNTKTKKKKKKKTNQTAILSALESTSFDETI